MPCLNPDHGAFCRLQALFKTNLAKLCAEIALIDKVSTRGFAACCSGVIADAASKCGPSPDQVANRACLKRQAIIANEALITCVDIIEKHLEHLFEACLRLSYHTKIFNLSRTIAMPKPDKPHYSCPNNQTPMTLLGALSNVLHKLVANRLTRFAVETACLPANQFGTSGKSTTMALQFILNHVYTAWSIGHKATLMGLDITGAYPRVNRHRLLEAVPSKNVPAWIIRFVLSWLDQSHTDLHLPGRQPEGFFISLRIPQGSSLSPILFLFFASGLLEIDLTGLSGVLAFMVSHVDDTYIIVRTGSFEKNCTALETLHDRVLAWAKANDVEFSPHKYGLLHFQREPKKERCVLLPGIPGLTRRHLEPPKYDHRVPPKVYKVPHLRILGVMVDTQLKWGPHIDHIAERVQDSPVQLLAHLSDADRPHAAPDETAVHGQGPPRLLVRLRRLVRPRKQLVTPTK